MTFPLQHKLLTIGGALFGGTERWSIGIRFANGFDANTGIDQADVDACQAPVRAWFSNASGYFPQVHTVDLIKLAPIGLDGKYPGTLAAKEAVITSQILGGNTSGTPLPAQCSLVISLTTPFTRGRAHIGRVYPAPVIAALVSTTGVVPSTNITTYMGQFRTMLNAIRAIPGLTAPAVMSKVGTGVSIGITGLRCGAIIDTQRRRRSSLPENYSAIAL